MITIFLQGGLTSDLNWQEAKALAESAAESAIETSSKIQWHIDLGLFKNLHKNFLDEAETLAILLAMQHFRDTLYKEFKEYTDKVIIYKGNSDFENELPWDDLLTNDYEKWKKDKSLNSKRLFARKVIFDYLELIRDQMPDEMPIAIELNIQVDHSLEEEIELLHPEYFGRLILDFKRQNPSLIVEEAKVALCLPNKNETFLFENEEMFKVTKFFKEQKIPFKIIPKTYLMQEWDGVDYLIVDTMHVESIFLRQLQGFAAAAGCIVSVGKKLDLPGEIDFADFVYSDLNFS